MSDTLATYNVQVIRPLVLMIGSGAPVLTQEDKRVLSNLPAMLEAVEEDLTKLLPEGYSARITEWNEED